MIDDFTGKYDFLSNHYPCKVRIGRHTYKNAEAAFQSFKARNEKQKTLLEGMNAEEAKEYGRTFNLRRNWKSKRYGYMSRAVEEKFKQNADLRSLLTCIPPDERISYANSVGDTYWGVCDGRGCDYLGDILTNTASYMRTKYSYDADMESELHCAGRMNAAEKEFEIEFWIRNWFERNGDGCNAVVGLSGGKDSAIAAAVLSYALGSDRVIGVMMPNCPIDEYKPGYDKEIADYLGIRSFVIPIDGMYAAGLDGIRKATGTEPSEQAKINLAPRIRMSVLYAVSQSNNGRVANTCNLSEDWVGYATRYGDGAGDFSLFANLTVKEVKEIGHAIGLPAHLVDVAPSDGLCGKTDEDNLGFTYETLDGYIRTGYCGNPDIKDKIDALHRRNAFKLKPMPSYDPHIGTHCGNSKKETPGQGNY